MRARTRTGDSGTHSQVASAASAVVATESQKIQEIEPWSTKIPASTSPDPPPIPNIADTVPIAGATRSRGNSSRMMPMASGKIAPPAPWMARPAIITVSEPATAATSEPTPKMASEMSSQCSLPCMSPKRPSSGVAIDEVSRKAVNSQVASAGPAWNSCWSSGSAGMTMVCASE